MVGRELTLFLHVDARAVPVKQRVGYVSLEVRRAAPFADAEYDVVWFGDHAAVWYWSHARVTALMDGPQRRKRLRAEACYRGTPIEGDAAELLELPVETADGEAYDAGIEARLWRHGYLLSSRWWPATPPAAQWQAFLRGGGMDPATTQPQVVPSRLRLQPLGGSAQSTVIAGQLREQWPLLASIAAALVIAAFAWQLAGLARIAQEKRHLEARILALEARLDGVMTARNKADEAQSRIRALLSLRPQASQTRLFGEIKTITPGSTWQLTAWHQPGPDSLDVTLKGDNLDIAAIVAAWEQSPLLEEVTPATGARPDEARLQARLTRRAASIR